jgi:ribosomal protein RSM22 (predicted rRNA methylase)
LKDPKSGKTAFKISQHSEEDFYTWMETRPIQQATFHRFMEAQFASLPTWLDVVSFESEIAHDASADDIVFVDVGGGNGSQCAALKKEYPHLQGRIILQDRPAVLESALQVSGMEKIPHDFLTEQPVNSKTTLCVTRLMLSC